MHHPAVVDTPYQKGLECARAGELANAETWLGFALVLDSGDKLAMLCLGDVLRRLGRIDEALPLLEKAVGLAPESWKAHSNLALALCEADRLEEAASALETASGLDGADAILNSNLAVVRKRQGRVDEAIRLLDQAVRTAPDSPEAHMNRALALLLAGRFEEGWREYEWRPKRPLSPNRPLKAHVHAGLPLTGKTVFVHEEQGMGDLIQFVRYAALLEKMGARVVIACDEPAHPLIRRARGVADVVPSGAPLPPFDLSAPLLSLPWILHPASGPVPVEIPYLHADPERVGAWAGHLGNEPRLRVGLVWGGNPGTSYDRRRSIPLERMAPVLRHPQAAFYALQRGPRRADLADLHPGRTVVDLEENCHGIMDTAAAIMCLDLVISVDTMAAHLAGALGKPVWVLLPFAPDWRWMTGRENSPWYPSMRLFRQSRPGDWDGVVGRVAEALGRLLL